MRTIFKVWLWINAAALLLAWVLLAVLPDDRFFPLILAAIASTVTELFCVLAWNWARRRNL